MVEGSMKAPPVNEGQQLSSKSAMNLFAEQYPAELHIRPASREQFDSVAIMRYSGSSRFHEGSSSNFARRPRSRFLTIIGHERYVSDAIPHKSVAHKFRTQSAQMNDARTAYEWSDEAHHEIDRVIGGQDAQIAHARPERIPGGQRDAHCSR
jgi:hypothetical protein